MALKFKSTRVPIPQTTGAFSSNEEVSFGRRVREAEVALKLFKLDFVGGARTTDITQVGVALQNIGDEAVEFSVTANYSGGTYTGEVHVLVVADVEERPPL
jgi:hypothetical protein